MQMHCNEVKNSKLSFINKNMSLSKLQHAAVGYNSGMRKLRTLTTYPKYP